MVSFYHGAITDRSWSVLLELSRQIPFVLIGGWAAWVYTQGDKSHDVDIVVDYATLGVLRQRYVVNKNDRLAKYEIPGDGFDVDIYVEHWSHTLAVAPEVILASAVERGGFRVPPAETLLALKLLAWQARSTSVKGEKDLHDVRGLIPLCDVDEWRRVMRESVLPRHRSTVREGLVLALARLTAKERRPWERWLTEARQAGD